MTREWRRKPLISLKTDSEMAGAGSRDRRWRTRGTLKPPERESRAEEVRLPPIPGPAAEQVALRSGDRAQHFAGRALKGRVGR